MEELADFAVESIRQFIDTEKQIVTKEHELQDLIDAWENMIPHLGDIIPVDLPALQTLLDDIIDKMNEIREIIESGEMENLRIEKEEEKTLNKLKEDIAHKDWRAVKKDIKKEKREERDAIRLEKHELHKLHKKFKELKELFLKKSLTSAIDLSASDQKTKKDFKEQHSYYLTHVFKFACAYEKIFQDLLEKEKHLAKDVKKKARKVPK